MKKTAFISLCVLTLICLASCASTSWVTNPYGQYDRGEYLAATGYGDSVAEADFNAKIELASLLGLNISTITEISITDTLTDSDVSFTKDSSVSTNVDNLYGVEIVQRTVQKDGTHISLAVMEKRTTLEYLQGNIKSEEDGVERLYSQVDEYLGSLNGLESASELVKSVNNYNTHIAMINYLSVVKLSYLDEQKALEKWQVARDSVTIGISVTGDDTGAVKSNIAKTLTSCGLRVSDVNKSCSATVECVINMREVQGSGVAASFVFAEYDASINMIDNLTGKTVLSCNLNGKEGHQNTTSAQTRAIKNLNEKISFTFGEEIKGKFASL